MVCTQIQYNTSIAFYISLWQMYKLVNLSSEEIHLKKYSPNLMRHPSMKNGIQYTRHVLQFIFAPDTLENPTQSSPLFALHCPSSCLLPVLGPSTCRDAKGVLLGIQFDAIFCHSIDELKDSHPPVRQAARRGRRSCLRT